MKKPLDFDKEFYEFMFEEDSNSEKKLIDIHTKKKIEDNSHYQQSISPSLVKKYIYENIDFELPENQWIDIDSSFSDIWNNKLGIGKEFYWDEISKKVFIQIRNKKILIEFERIDKIVTLMLTFIEENGGFLKE